MDKVIKLGSHWAGTNSEKFEILLVSKDTDSEQDTIFYRNIKTNKDYSCWKGAFLERFREIPSES